MSVKYATPLHLDLKRSKIFDLYLYSVFLITLFSIYLLPIALIMKILLSVMSVVACIYAFKSHQKPQSLVWQENNHWLLRYGKDTVSAELIEDSFAISWLVILHFKTDSGSRCSQLVCYDSLDSRLFRQLKVRLKVEGLKNKLHVKMGL